MSILLATDPWDGAAKLAEILSPVMLAIITLCSLLVTFFTIFGTWLMKRIDTKATAAAIEVSAVKKTLGEKTESQDKKLDALAATADATHTLVNSNMGVQLKLNAELSRWKAAQTGKPEDATAADLAEKLLREHELKQSNVDRQGEL